jgi:RNA polymerase sigma factor (sigma-70 family)
MRSRAREIKLLEQCLKGNSQAFEVIVGNYQELVCAITFSGVTDFQQSEELAHQTFINAWKNLSQLKDLSRFRPWLCTIARNNIRNFLNKNQRDIIAKTKAMENINDTAADEAGPLESAINKEHEELVSDAIRRIPEQYREPLVLYYRRQQSVKQVALSLDLSQDVVKQRLHRGRKMIKEQLSSIVEETLSATGPKKAFTTAVIASIAGMAIKGTGVAATASIVAGTSTTGTTTGIATLMSGVTAKIITAAAVAAIGVGAVVAYKQITKPKPGPVSFEVVSTLQEQSEEKNEFVEEAAEQKQRDEVNASFAKTTKELPLLELEQTPSKPTEDNQSMSEVPVKETATYRGVVKDAAGNPIEGVIVRRYWYSHNLPGGWTDDIEAITNVLGEYELGPLPVIDRGNNIDKVLLFEHPEHGIGWFSLRNELSIILSEPSFIAGKVVDEHGTGIEGATIIAILPLYHYDRNQANGHFETSTFDNLLVTTNADGQFVFENLPSGSRLHLSVLKKGYEIYETTTIYDRFKYPIRTGHEDLLITLKPGGAIKGQLVLDGNPYQRANILVKAHTTGGRIRGCAITNEKGQFEIIGLATQHYTLIINERFFESAGLICKPAENLKAKTNQESAVELELHKGIPVTIQVSDKETGEGIDNHFVSIALFDPNHYQTDKPVNFRVADGRTNDAGQCVINLTPNYYRLIAQSRKDGRQELVEQDFRITDDQSEFNLTVGVIVQPKVYGWLVDSNSEPIHGHMWFARRYTKTDEHGEFEVDEPRGSATDVYTCYAFDMDKTLGRGFLWQRSDDVNDLEIVLEPLASIVGRLVDANGEGVASVKPEISIVQPDGRGSRERLRIWNTTVENDGSFSIEGIPTGLKMMIKTASNLPWNVVSIGKLQHGRMKAIEIGQLLPGEVRDVGEVFVKRETIQELEDNNIEWDGSLSGYVTNEDGEAMIGFDLEIYYGKKQFRELTDINGWYEFVGLPGNKKVELRVSGIDDNKVYRDSFETFCDGNYFDIHLLPQKQK